MPYNQRTLVTTRTLSGAGTKYRIVRETGTDGQVIQASAANQALMGVISDRDIADTAVGDICQGGITPIEYGGVVAAGNPLTSDASGRGVLAAAGNSVIGTAQESGVLGTIGSVLIAPVRPFA